MPDSLAHGRVVIQYRVERLRIVPVFGPAALEVSPRIGHIHVTVEDARDVGPTQAVSRSSMVFPRGRTRS